MTALKSLSAALLAGVLMTGPALAERQSLLLNALTAVHFSPVYESTYEGRVLPGGGYLFFGDWDHGGDPISLGCENGGHYWFGATDDGQGPVTLTIILDGVPKHYLGSRPYASDQSIVDVDMPKTDFLALATFFLAHEGTAEAFRSLTNSCGLPK